MLNQTLTLNKTLSLCLLAMGLLACEGEETTAPAINCGAGTTLSAAGDACEANLSEGLSVNAAGEIVADTTGADTEAALAAAREEGRAEGAASVDITTDNEAAREEGRAQGVASVDITTDNQAAFDEGAASVTPLNCTEGTAVNEAGNACEPTAEYRAAAVEEGRVAGAASVDITTDNQAAYDEGRMAGVASVMPLNCADGTAENEAGDACEPTAEYRAAAVEEGRAAGVASVTPLNCADGTAVNVAGDACEPTAEYRGAAVEEGRAAGVAAGRAEGVASVTPLNCAEGTAENEAGDACEPTVEYRAAAVEEGRLAGVASVDITSNDADVIAAATADLLTQAEVAADYLSRVEVAAQYLSRVEVAAQYLSRVEVAAQYLSRVEVAAQYLSRDEVAAQYLSRVEVAAQYLSRDEVAATYVTRAEAEAARQAGVASVTPLNCDAGTGENDAGDACEPNLSVDVAIGDEDTIVPNDAYAAQVCEDGGGTFDAQTGTCDPTYDCFRGGYCSEAPRVFGFGANQGNLYDGDTLEGSGCAVAPQGRDEWRAGVQWGQIRVCNGWHCGMIELCR